MEQRKTFRLLGFLAITAVHTLVFQKPIHAVIGYLVLRHNSRRIIVTKAL